MKKYRGPQHNRLKPFAWTSAADAKLTALWLVPENTVVAIGAVFGISDNAVSGRARRIGLKPKGNPRIGPAKTKMPEKAATPVQVEQIEPPRPPGPSLVEAIAVALQRLPKACQFPTSRTKPFRFCDAMALEGEVYCQGHCEIAYVNFNARRGKQEREAA